MPVNNVFKADLNRKKTLVYEESFYSKERAEEARENLDCDTTRITSIKVGARPWKGNNYTQRYMYTLRGYNN